MKTKYVIISVCIVGFTACSKKNLVDGHKRNILKTQSATSKIERPEITSSSYLFADVDKNIQDSVIKRLKMDLHPDIEYYKKKSLFLRHDIPNINISTLKFIPAIIAPRALGGIQGDNLVAISKEFACFFGKTESGDDVYMWATYKDWSKIPLDTNSPVYQAEVKMSGLEKINSLYRTKQSRRGADCWTITVFIKGSLMHQIFDFARRNADDGKLFVLAKGEHQHNICYFKDGKALWCHKSNQGDIRTSDFYDLITYQ